jgi:hypothetical protein
MEHHRSILCVTGINYSGLNPRTQQQQLGCHDATRHTVQKFPPWDDHLTYRSGALVPPNAQRSNPSTRARRRSGPSSSNKALLILATINRCGGRGVFFPGCAVLHAEVYARALLCSPMRVCWEKRETDVLVYALGNILYRSSSSPALYSIHSPISLAGQSINQTKPD